MTGLKKIFGILLSLCIICSNFGSKGVLANDE